MNMRVTVTGLALGAAMMAGAAFAAPAYEGAWDAVHAATPGTTTPANFKLIIWMKQEGANLHYHSENTTMPATPYISDHVSPLDGTPAPFPNQTRYNMVATLLTEPTELQILKKKDDDVISGEFWTFSADGKTAVRRGIGKSPEGKSYPYQEHFVRVTATAKYPPK